MKDQFLAVEYLNSRAEGVNVLQYNQVKNMVNKLLKKQVVRKELIKFESLLHSGDIFKKILSKIYTLLLDTEKMEDERQQSWERNIQGAIEWNEWQATNNYIRLISSNITIHESYYNKAKMVSYTKLFT